MRGAGARERARHFLSDALVIAHERDMRPLETKAQLAKGQLERNAGGYERAAKHIAAAYAPAQVLSMPYWSALIEEELHALTMSGERNVQPVVGNVGSHSISLELSGLVVALLGRRVPSIRMAFEVSSKECIRLRAHHLKQVPLAWNTFQRKNAAILERQTGAGDQILDGTGHPDLASLCQGGDT